MFQFRRFPSYSYLIHCRIRCGGFPHSEISGSQLICSSPKLIAAYHVLHRLLMPRHSPCALISLTNKAFSLYKLTSRKVHFMVLYKLNYAGSYVWSLFRQNCILPNFLKNKFPFMLPSHNCIIIIDIQFSRCILNLFLKKLSEASLSRYFNQSLGGD